MLLKIFSTIDIYWSNLGGQVSPSFHLPTSMLWLVWNSPEKGIRWPHRSLLSHLRSAAANDQRQPWAGRTAPAGWPNRPSVDIHRDLWFFCARKKCMILDPCRLLKYTNSKDLESPILSLDIRSFKGQYAWVKWGQKLSTHFVSNARERERERDTNTKTSRNPLQTKPFHHSCLLFEKRTCCWRICPWWQQHWWGHNVAYLTPKLGSKISQNLVIRKFQAPFILKNCWLPNIFSLSPAWISRREATNCSYTVQTRLR